MMPELLILGAFGLGLLLAARSPAAAPLPELAAQPRRRLTVLEVEQLAQLTVARGAYDVDPAMLIAMAWIESGFDPRAVGDDGSSRGLMQIALRTAEDIQARLGGRIRSPDDLFDAAVSMDFAARYVAWLRTWNGARRPDAWVVQAYNGGPGTAAAGGNSLTRRHLCRYEHTLAAYRAGRTLPNVASLPC